VPSHAEPFTVPQPPDWREGFWPHGLVTPERRKNAIEWARVVFSWRDVCSIFAIVWLLWLIKSDLRDLNTNFEAYQRQQAEVASAMNFKIDETRRRAESAFIKADEAEKELASLRGYLDGLGIKGVKK